MLSYALVGEIYTFQGLQAMLHIYAQLRSLV